MPSHNITILLYPVIRSRGDLVSTSFKHVYNPRIELPKRGVNYTLSNRCNGADLMFLFKEGLSLIIRRLSFNANTNFLFSLVSTLKLSKDGKWL